MKSATASLAWTGWGLAFLFLWGNTTSSAQDAYGADLRGRSLTIVDEVGRKRILLTVNKNRPMVILCDQRGRQRVVLLETKSGGAVEVRGAGRSRSSRVTGGDTAGFDLLNGSGRVKGRFALNRGEWPEVVALDGDGNRLKTVK